MQTNMLRHNPTHRYDQVAGHRNCGHRHMADELMGMLDEHLAWQTARERDRPTSAGTMIADWDGTGVPVISYRKVEPEVTPQARPERTAKTPKPKAPTAHRDHQHTVQLRLQTYTQASQAKSRQQRENIEEREWQPIPLRTSTAQIPSRVHISQVPSIHRTLRDSPYPRPSRGQLHLPSTIHRKPVPERHRASKPPPHHDSVLSRHPGASHHSQPRSQHHYPTSGSKYAQIVPRTHSSSTTAHFHYNPQDLRVYYKPAHNIVHGYDPDTDFDYDYNGQIVHVHRSPTQSSASWYSEYYKVDADTYTSTGPIKVVDKELPDLPRASLTHVTKKRDKVVIFVKALLKKLDGMGVLGQMKMEKERRRVMGSKL